MTLSLISTKSKKALALLSDLAKMLTGFSNTMLPNHAPPTIKAEFRDHKSPGIADYLITDRTFFTPEDFEAADHRIQGEFDEFGQFSGKVNIYGGDPIKHIVPWARSHGRPTECGPFRIDVAYVQGLQRDTRLTPERFGEITKKLHLFGGIYIYRDGIRVLPYGNQDYDFLRIEERRNKSASYYYFSYRRIFGALSISQNQNPNLVEKAGREGFQENLGYRQFKDILEKFFIQTASSFFRVETRQGEEFADKRSELQKRDDLAHKREQQVRGRRHKLESDLDSWFSRLASGEIDQQVKGIISGLQRELAGLASETRSAVIEGTLRAEQGAYQKLAALRAECRISQPRGVGLTRNLRRDLDAYRVEFNRLEVEVLRAAESTITHEVSSFSKQLDASIDKRRRLEHSSKVAVDEARGEARRLVDDTRKIVDEVSSRVKTTLSQSSRDFENTLNGILTEVQRISLEQDTDDELAEVRYSIEDKIDNIALANRHLSQTLSAQLASVKTPDEDLSEFVTELDLTEAAEEELLALREAADDNLELVLLGQALDATQHEFQTAIISIRDGLRDLEAWARVNERLADVYGQVKVAFEHLDSYLSLFTPLRRRLNPVETDVAGAAIEDFVQELFATRLEQQQIELTATDEFIDFTVRGFRSTFYPVFVNLVDNAIFWLSDQPSPRRILLHILNNEMAVSDTGPGVSARDRQAIFESGFTRKPGGRGLGLYISKDALTRVGYALQLISVPYLGGATFRIKQILEN